MPKINKYRKKTELPELAGVEEPHMQHLILKTIEATERFYGHYPDDGTYSVDSENPVWKHRYLRTASEHMYPKLLF